MTELPRGDPIPCENCGKTGTPSNPVQIVRDDEMGEVYAICGDCLQAEEKAPLKLPKKVLRWETE